MFAPSKVHMGCICTKAISPPEQAEIHREKDPARFSRKFTTPPSTVEIVRSDSQRNDFIIKPTVKPQEKTIAPLPVVGEKKQQPSSVVTDIPPIQTKVNAHQRWATVDIRASEAKSVMGISHVPNDFEAEHVAAGWPPWLVSVAGEAIKGWLPRRVNSFEKLYKIGQGTYSNVYKARDLETGKVVALKKVRFVNMDPESVRFMAREIHVLRRLDHPNIVKLECLITSRTSSSLYLVFEYMEHDLAGLAANPSITFTESQIKCYMKQLLCGLEHCHSRGVMHRDIKGANLLIDNNGVLKLADFGLATVFDREERQPLTSRVVTLWYRPPELLLGATNYDVTVDLWSSGCILAELLFRKPIMPGRTEVEQLHKIFKLCGSPSEEYWRRSKLPNATIFKPHRPYNRCVLQMFSDFPSSALALLDVLLAIEPEHRGTASSALSSEFFTTDPLPCDPSALPKYPPSKEFDAKLRDEEARRKKEATVKGQGSESMRRDPISSNTRLVPDGFTGNGHPQQYKKHAKTNPRSTSISENYNLQDDAVSRFLVDPPKRRTQNGVSHSGPFMMHPNAYETSQGNSDVTHLRPHQIYSCGEDQHTIPGSGMERRNLNVDGNRDKNSIWKEHASRFSPMDEEDSEKQNWWPSSSHTKDEIMASRQPIMEHGIKKNRIHYSGPLMPPGGNIEDMLKEHERHIQQAVRKARFEKTKSRRNSTEKGPFEGMLFPGRDGNLYV